MLIAVLCRGIVIFGHDLYQRKRSAGALLIGIAFVLIYYLPQLCDPWTGFNLGECTARISGYVLVIAARFLIPAGTMDVTNR